MKNNFKNLSDSLGEYYKNKDYKKIFDMYLNYGKEISDVRYLLYVMFETGNWNEFSQILILHEKDFILWDDTSRICGYMGLIAFSEGNYVNAKLNLQVAINQNGEYSHFAYEWLLVLQLSEFNFVNRNKLNFHFSNDLISEIKTQFIRKYVKAYDRITQHFPDKGKKNIDIYVFGGWKDNINNNLSYANSMLSTIHVNVTDDAGHELTHILSSYNLSIKLKFIDEGIAEYYDDLIRGYRIEDDFYNLSLCDCCSAFQQFNKDHTYLFARVFISHVFEYYRDNIEASRLILEASSYQDMLDKSCKKLLYLEKRTKTTIKRLEEKKKHGELVYIGRNDLYIL